MKRIKCKRKKEKGKKVHLKELEYIQT